MPSGPDSSPPKQQSASKPKPHTDQPKTTDHHRISTDSSASKLSLLVNLRPTNCYLQMLPTLALLCCIGQGRTVFQACDLSPVVKLLIKAHWTYMWRRENYQMIRTLLSPNKSNTCQRNKPIGKR